MNESMPKAANRLVDVPRLPRFLLYREKLESVALLFVIE